MIWTEKKWVVWDCLEAKKGRFTFRIIMDDDVGLYSLYKDTGISTAVWHGLTMDEAKSLAISVSSPTSRDPRPSETLTRQDFDEDNGAYV